MKSNIYIYIGIYIGTHHSIGNDAVVGSEFGVDVGEKPAERAALESGSQGFSSGNIPDVYSRVLAKEKQLSTFTYPELSVIPTFLRCQ